MKYRKKPYPRNNDIAEAILEALWKYPLVKPIDFYEKIILILEEKGFYTGLVNRKRVWRVYEDMVKRGNMPDYLMVVKDSEDELEV